MWQLPFSHAVAFCVIGELPGFSYLRVGSLIHIALAAGVQIAVAYMKDHLQMSSSVRVGFADDGSKSAPGARLGITDIQDFNRTVASGEPHVLRLGSANR